MSVNNGLIIFENVLFNIVTSNSKLVLRFFTITGFNNHHE